MDLYKGIIIFVGKASMIQDSQSFHGHEQKFKDVPHFNDAHHLSHFHLSFCEVLGSPLYFLFLNFIKAHNRNK